MSKYLLIPVVLFSVSPVFAQGGGPPPVNKVNAERMRQQDMSRREYELRNFGNESSAPKDKRQVEALMAQTEEDFNRILTLHNELARALTSKEDLNYEFVSDATAEINKRASRVQHSLALGVSDEEAREIAKSKDDEPIKDSLVKLCNQIRSFVTNPSIENPNTINVDQMKKARHDLESLIQLSGRVKKDADKQRH